MVDVCVVGLGTLGRATAALLTRGGARVHGVDTDPARLDLLADPGVALEPGLAALLAEALDAGLTVGGSPVPAAATVIAVPTPLSADAPDLTALWSAVRAIRPHQRPGDLVLIESTCPVGTADAVAAALPGSRVATCPERAMPGQLLAELVGTDRIVGGVTAHAAEAAARVYGLFITGQIHRTDARTAELTKLVENASRAVLVAFANEVAMLADAVGVDPWEVRTLANHHPRVNLLRPGPGVGGHCLPVDPLFLAHAHPEVARMVRAAAQTDVARRRWVVDQVVRAAALHPGPVVCLGLAYKADVSDLRGSAALHVVRDLRAALGDRVRAVDPHVIPPSDVPVIDLVQALDGAALVVALVAHTVFRGVDLGGVPRIDVAGVYR
ncbi:MAG: UDP-N-acetyl-D-mannosaminuronic acid dehydrogenase [Myxococcota bacterium]|jgi:UDP-N-acetyl-D-mannosaminuronic acid dehydrogenase